MDRAELGITLRTWRERLQPSDVGLPVRARRRTPGLRREAVAQLAGISVDYLVRLEQGRGPRPSQSVLEALGRALRLTEHELEHLFHLSGAAPPTAGRLTGSVKPSVLRLLDRFGDLPALLLDAKGDVLAWNPLAAALLGDYSAWPPGQRNLIWQCFTGGPHRIVTTPEQRAQADAHMVADLRAAAARYPDDPGVRRLVTDLRARSPRFEVLWQQRAAAIRRSSRKQIRHPEIGLIELDCDVLEVPDADQRLIVYSAPPGSPEADALALLRVLGTQDLSGQPR